MIRKFCMIVVAIALTACATLKPPHDEAPVVWELTPASSSVAGGTPVDAVLHVARPGAAAALATTGIAYRQRDFERRYYARNRWVDEPARLLHLHLVAAIEEAGLFESVVSTAATPPARYRLETELLELEQDFRDRAQGVARIDLRARFVDLQSGAVLATRRFEAESPSSAANPAAGVAAINDALERLIRDLSGWIRGLVVVTD